MIKRYDPVVEYQYLVQRPEAGMDEQEQGEWVRYTDHLELVKKLHQRIAELKDELVDMKMLLLFS